MSESVSVPPSLPDRDAPPRPSISDEAEAVVLTDEERDQLRKALLRGPNATWIRDLPGPTDISGSFVPELAYTVQLIIAARLTAKEDDRG